MSTKRNFCNYSIIIIFLLFLLGCTNDNDYTFVPTMVVEGSIGIGEPAVIVLSQLLPPNEELDSVKINKIVLRWGKITINNGETSEIMTGHRDTAQTLKYSYYTRKMRGEVGKTYTIVAEYGETTVSAKTTIPKPIELSKITPSLVSEENKTYILKAEIDYKSDSTNYYIISSKVKGESNIYKPTMGAWCDNDFSKEIPVYRSIDIVNNQNYRLFYNENDTVDIRLEHIDKVAYDYWFGFTENFLSVANPIVPYYHNIKSNIEGGLGVWYGYGSNEYRVIVK